ncbi:MAG: hypothetical protein ACLTZI_01370 [[Eubacterium] siraeum]
MAGYDIDGYSFDETLSAVTYLITAVLELVEIQDSSGSFETNGAKPQKYMLKRGY